jgi:hypothetical protein
MLMGIEAVSNVSIRDPSVLFGANLIAWYKADTGVFNDLGTTPATNTQTVEQWNDQSGNGINLINSGTSSTRPVFLSGGLNGKNTVQFSAANQTQIYSAVDALSTGGPTVFSVFAVCQMLTGTTSYGYLAAFWGSGAPHVFDNAASSGFIMRQTTNNAFESYRNNADLSPSSISLATNYRLGFVNSGSTGTSFTNGVATGTPTASTGNFGSTGTFYLGTDAPANIATATAWWDGPCSEVVVVNIDINAAGKVGALDNYFKSKWGL